MIRCIVAMDNKQGIANDHGIPWQGKIPGDVTYYREKIEGQTVIMGYGLYKELSKPYPNCKNYVATTSSEKLREGFEPIADAHKFLEEAQEDIWNLGGAMLYASTIDLVDEVYVTQLEGDFDCTKFFPPFKNEFQLVQVGDPITENGITYRFQVWQRAKAYA